MSITCSESEWYEWPRKRPDEYLDYAIDVSAPLIRSNDTLAGYQISQQPWGDGEIIIDRLDLIDAPTLALAQPVIWLRGGFPGRAYRFVLDVFTTGGREFSFYILLTMERTAAIYAWTDAPNDTASTPVVYNSEFGTNYLLGADGAILQGADGAFLAWGNTEVPSDIANQPFLPAGALVPRTLGSWAADVITPQDFGAVADGASHPAGTRYLTLQACQVDYPFATDLMQELDFLAWQKALYAGGSVISRSLPYKLCNASPASMTPLMILAGTVYVTGNGAQMDWSDLASQPNYTHYISNYDFSSGGDGWVVDVVDSPLSQPVFENGSAYCADPPSFTRFGQKVTLQPGHYVVKWSFIATLGGSYPENPSPPFGEINFWSVAPGAGDQFPSPLPVAMAFPNLTAVIQAGEEGITVSGSSNLNIAETYTGYLCFTGGGYANWRVTLLDIVPFQPNCGIWVTRDNTPGEYYNIDKAIAGLELIGGGRANSASALGSAGPTAIMFESFVNNDGNLADFQDCAIHGWGTGIWPRDGAYLIEFRNCLLYNNDVALYFNGAQNAGENIRFYGGGIFNNLFGIINPHPYGEFTFYGTALDYNYGSIAYNTGKLEFHGCHIENNLKDAPIFHCSGGSIMMYGGTILGVAPLINPADVVPPIQLDDSNSLMTCFGTQIYNLTSADGTFVGGPGTFRADNWINTGNPNLARPSATTIALDPLGGAGNLEPFTGSPFIAPDPSGIYIEGGVYGTGGATFTDRWTADGLSLALSTDAFHTGTRSIKVAKSAAPGTDYQIVFMVPVKQAQDASLSFWWYSPTSYQAPASLASITWESIIGVGKATATTGSPHGQTIGSQTFLYIQGADQTGYNGIHYCTFTTTTQFTYEVDSGTTVPPATGDITWCPCATMYARVFWAKQIGIDTYGRPLLSPANTFKGEIDIAMPLCGYPNWQQHGGSTFYGPSTVDPTIGDSPGAPVWATHMAIVLDTESMPAMTFYIDDFVAYIV